MMVRRGEQKVGAGIFHGCSDLLNEINDWLTMKD